MLVAQASRRIRSVGEQHIVNLVREVLQAVYTWQVQAAQFFSERAVLVLQLRKELGGDFADVVFQRHDGVASQFSQPGCSACQYFVGRTVAAAKRNANDLERIVGFDGIDGLLAIDGDLTSSHLELDLTRQQHGRHQIAQGVSRPTKGRISKGISQALAVDCAVAIDVVTDAHHGQVVRANAVPPALGLHKVQRIESAGDARQIADPEEFLSEFGSGAHRGLYIAIEHLLGHFAQVFASGIQQLSRQRIYCDNLATEDERALQQAALDLCPQFGAEMFSPVGLAVAIFANFLIWIAAVAVGDLTAAVDVSRQFVHFRRRAAHQVDVELG
ncbi:hypothetical protein D3C81_934020 [compost metagenome]